MKQFDHAKIEQKWRKQWAKDTQNETPDVASGKENYYLLVEFPYPSGNLHVGHWYSFAVPDILARHLRMKGKNVLYPIGFDAFGLPAENAAIKNKVNPRKWTEENIAYMKKQIESMGTIFDWSRVVSTIDPKYYRWTQWLFLQFFKRGLAYRKETAVNWCPVDKTVLANEQVVDGHCERCGALVEQKQMLQWNLKITEYADRLIDDLAPLDWPEQIKEAQRNWIGRSEGYEIDFPLKVNDDVKRIIILHCKGATPDDIYYPWLKDELEKRGYEVKIPTLPNPEEPNDEEQADYVEQNVTFGEDTAIIGHSFGGIVAMRLLERGHVVHHVTLAAVPYSGTFLDGKTRNSVTAACKKGFDFKTIRKNAKGFLVVVDSTDPVVPLSDNDAWVHNLDGMFIRGKGVEPHFQGLQERDILMASSPHLRVFTTRPDTLFGGTFLVLAPEHPWVTLAIDSNHHVLSNTDEVRAYVEAAKNKTDLERQIGEKEKTGVELKGVKAINPTTGKEIPLWVADYALMGFGTGALFGDAHDERDVAFAKKYSIPLKETLEPVFIRTSGYDAIRFDVPFRERHSIFAIVKHWSEDKYLCLAWKDAQWKGFIVGGIEEGETPEQAAIREIREETGYIHPRFIGQAAGNVHSKFYHSLKKINIYGHFTPLLFQLEDDVREEISDEEKKIHDIVWIDGTSMLEFLTAPDMQFTWRRMHSDACYEGKGILYDSDEFSGMTSDEAIPAVGETYGRRVNTYRLRDWIVSRQRYWGVPIPIVHCKACGSIAVPGDQLPVELPDVEDYLPTGEGYSPLAKVTSFVNTTCPQCGGEATRETDTLDTFVDSSWYYLRYTDAHNDKEFAAREKQNHWMPVNFYSGGPEHTTMHVLYSRFWHKALFDLGLVQDSEPYLRRMSHGLILGPDGQKMSKSHGNVIDPDDIVERLGADTLRLYLAFIGPYNEVGTYPWDPNGVVGVRRFVERVGRFEEQVVEDDIVALEASLHRMIKKVGEDIVALKFNTAISQMMIFMNAAEKQGKIGIKQWKRFLRVLAPFAPVLSEELWSRGQEKSSIHMESWPEYDSTYLTDETIAIAIQINGKTRGEVNVARDADKVTVESAAREVVAERLAGAQIARTIIVPGRLVNFVLDS